MTPVREEGVRSAGVRRQYSVTAGKVENCQIGRFLAYASPKGRALIDRELYLPKSWTDDPALCQRAAVPADVGFATKPQQARVMIERAVAAGVPFAWFTADEAFGQNPGLRSWLVTARGLTLPPSRQQRAASAPGAPHSTRCLDPTRDQFGSAAVRVTVLHRLMCDADPPGDVRQRSGLKVRHTPARRTGSTNSPWPPTTTN
jgi:DDE superfamily endonuclease